MASQKFCTLCGSINGIGLSLFINALNRNNIVLHPFRFSLQLCLISLLSVDKYVIVLYLKKPE